jgi:excinuclease UvrABC helicase subunit UvrB
MMASSPRCRDRTHEETRHLVGKDLNTYIAEPETRMREHAANLEFEDTAALRD